MQLYKLEFSKRLCAIVKLENVTHWVYWSLEWGLCDEFTSLEREAQMQLYESKFSKYLCALIEWESVAHCIHCCLEWSICYEFTSWERQVYIIQAVTAEGKDDCLMQERVQSLAVATE